MINAELQNEYFGKGGMNMSKVKMGLTIEEAAECTGIGRNTMRKLVDWGSLFHGGIIIMKSNIAE